MKKVLAFSLQKKFKRNFTTGYNLLNSYKCDYGQGGALKLCL